MSKIGKLFERETKVTGDKSSRRVTIPKAICDMLRIDVGDRVAWLATLDKYGLEIKVVSENSIGEDFVNNNVYITSFEKNPITAQNLTEEYDEECFVCGNVENLVISTILPEKKYMQLSNESWNKIFLCESCKDNLDKLNKENENGFKNLFFLIKKENKKRIKWFNED